MKMKIYTFLSCLFLLVACNDRNEPVDSEAQRTVLAYWVADNGQLDLSAYAISDFNEMVEGMAEVDVTKNNLLIYCETKSDLPRLIHVKKKKGAIVADTIKTYSEQNPLNMTVMSSIINEVVENYPAKSYGLVFASHADGWLKALISANPATRHIGDYRGTQMNITDLCAVLEGAPHMDFILFDACYMQAIEVAYELRDYADYIIASPTEIPGPGAPYQRVIPKMFANKKDVGVDIGNAYYSYYGDENGQIKSAEYILGGSNTRWTEGVSISVLKTSELNALAVITKEILTRYVDNKEKINTSSLFYYGSDITYTIRYYDFDRLIRQITNENTDYIKWRVAFNNAQLYFKTTKTNYAARMGGDFDMSKAEGVYMYVPGVNTAQHEYYQTLEWYFDGGWQAVGW